MDILQLDETRFLRHEIKSLFQSDTAIIRRTSSSVHRWWYVKVFIAPGNVAEHLVGDDSPKVVYWVGNQH